MLLVLAGIYWRGWLLWCLVILFMGIQHPRLLDERESLDPARRRIALACLAIFVLSFMPVPVSLPIFPDSLLR